MRAARLFQMALELKLEGEHVRMLRAIELAVSARTKGDHRRRRCGRSTPKDHDYNGSRPAPAGTRKSAQLNAHDAESEQTGQDEINRYQEVEQTWHHEDQHAEENGQERAKVRCGDHHMTSLVGGSRRTHGMHA